MSCISNRVETFTIVSVTRSIPLSLYLNVCMVRHVVIMAGDTRTSFSCKMSQTSSYIMLLYSPMPDTEVLYIYCFLSYSNRIPYLCTHTDI